MNCKLLNRLQYFEFHIDPDELNDSTSNKEYYIGKPLGCSNQFKFDSKNKRKFIYVN